MSQWHLIFGVEWQMEWHQEQVSADGSKAIAIQPTHRLTFAAPDCGRSVAFHPNEKTAWVHSWEAAIDLWPVTIDYAVYPSAGIAGLLILILIWRIWRVWRLPRRRGRIYCRSCNYDVTEQLAAMRKGGDAPAGDVPVGDDRARCPECGSACSAKRLVSRRAFFVRLARLTVATAIAVLAAGGLALLKWPLHAAAQGWCLWPSRTAYEIAAPDKWQWMLAHQIMRDAVDEIDLDTGQQVRRLYRGRTSSDALLTAAADGSGLFLATHEGLIRIDTSTGNVRRCDTDLEDITFVAGAPSVVREDAPAHEVYFQAIRQQRSQYVLFRWNLVSGVAEEMLTGDIAVQAWGHDSDPSIFRAMDGNGEARWLVSERHSGDYSWAWRVLKLVDADGMLLARRSSNPSDIVGVIRLDAGGSEPGLAVFEVTPSGSILLLNPRDLTKMKSIELRGPIDLQGAAASSDGRYIFVAGSWYCRANGHSLLSMAAALWVVDVASGTTVAELQVPAGDDLHNLSLSSGGRWAAADCVAGATLNVPLATSDLHIWALRALETPPQP